MTGWEHGDWRDENLCQFEESNLLNKMGLEFYDLSHPWGLGQPCWPYFEDVKIERLHGMAKTGGVLTQKITTVMHSGTHIDAPAHVVPGTIYGRSSTALLFWLWGNLGYTQAKVGDGDCR